MIEEEINIIERNVNQLRGYFQAQEDILIKNNALRMLDEIEIILKKN